MAPASRTTLLGFSDATTRSTAVKAMPRSSTMLLLKLLSAEAAPFSKASLKIITQSVRVEALLNLVLSRRVSSTLNNTSTGSKLRLAITRATTTNSSSVMKKFPNTGNSGPRSNNRKRSTRWLSMKKRRP